jgi:hypothetical protein
MRRSLVALTLLVGACGGGHHDAARSTTSNVALTTTTSSTIVATTSSAPPATALPAGALTAADLPASWRAGCPVPPSQLRRLTLDYWGFDDQGHQGTLIVNASVASAITKVFATLYRDHFPIKSMQPVDVYGGSDERSLEADNTAGFNCRNAVSSGPPHWSAHAYGLAIDVNPVENPYVESNGVVHPKNGSDYVNRSPYRPGMAVSGGELVNAFASVGWKWGGRWTSSPDYQHFSSSGG